MHFELLHSPALETRVRVILACVDLSTRIIFFLSNVITMVGLGSLVVIVLL